jgi:hypothetical protein
MGAQHVHDECRIDRPAVAAAQAVRDPRRLGPLLELAHVLLAAAAIHREDRDEAPAGDEADEQQPPLEFRHVAGRIGRVEERTLGRG